MNSLQKLLGKLDRYQQRRRLAGFSLAVIKKYGDDEAGRYAALLTYYAFLSLFPLLLVLTTLTERIAGRNPHLESQVLSGITNYFPLLGSQLAAHIHGLHKSGLALVIGVLFTLYGTRGVADAFRSGVCKIWGVPEEQREGFPKSAIRSLVLVIVGGLGFIAAAIVAGLASAAGHGVAFRTLSVALNLFILFWLFTFLLNFSLPRHVTIKETRVGAATAAIGLVILQLIGNIVLRHQLKHLDALYSTFAVALGLLFWIYLQTQVLYYAIEIAVVSSRKLWPRSLT